MIALVLATALAADPATLVERGRVALDEGRAMDARALALEASAADPQDFRAQHLYLQASEAAGMGPIADAGFSALADETPSAAIVWVWHEVLAGAESQDTLGMYATVGKGPERDLALLALADTALREGDLDLASGAAYESNLPEAAELLVRARMTANDPRGAAAIADKSLARFKGRPDVLRGLFLPMIGDDGAILATPAKLRKSRDALLERVLAADRPSAGAAETWRLRRLMLAVGDTARVEALDERLRTLGEPLPELNRPYWTEGERIGAASALIETPDPAGLTGSMSERIDIAERVADALWQLDRDEEAARFLDGVRPDLDSRKLASFHALSLLTTRRGPESAIAARQEALLACLPAPDDAARMSADATSHDLGTALAELGVALYTQGDPQSGVWFARAAAVDPTAKRPWDDVWKDQGTWRDPLDATFRAETAAAALSDARAEPDPDGALVLATVAALIGGDTNALDLRGELLEKRGAPEAAFVAFASAGDTAGIGRTWNGLGGVETAAIAAVAGGWSIPAIDREPELDPRGVRLGEPVPDLVLPGADPATHLSDLRGRVVVVSFWASWCGPCLHELPAMGALSDELSAGGVPVTFVAISIDEEKASYEPFKQRPDLRSIVLGWAPELAEPFHVQGIPAMWIIDADGVARHHHTGYGAGMEDQVRREVLALVP